MQICCMYLVFVLVFVLDLNALAITETSSDGSVLKTLTRPVPRLNRVVGIYYI